MAKRNNSKKTSCFNGSSISGCSPTCPYFPNQDEVKWYIGEDGLKHRDEPLIRCGYNGSFITSWKRICPWKEDKRNLLLEKKQQQKVVEKPVNTEKKPFKKKKSYKKKANKIKTDKT